MEDFERRKNPVNAPVIVDKANVHGILEEIDVIDELK